MGMLAVMGMVLALDGFGPIADNAAGIAEMAGEKTGIETMEALDAVGNTTKALTKGFALGSALLAAQLLFQTYAEEVYAKLGVTLVVDISNPAVLVAGFIGAMLPFLFSSQAISAVGKAATQMVNEVRRQFKEIPGIMEGTGKPDYGKAVDISTKAALKGMVIPGVIVVVVPISHRCPLRSSRSRCSRHRNHTHSSTTSTIHEHRRWRMGQRKEIHRIRPLRRQRQSQHTQQQSSVTQSVTHSKTQQDQAYTYS